MAQHNLLGQEGEALAVNYLQKHGYKIVEVNWRYKKAEIDIISMKDNVLAIVEVKTRTNAVFGTPQEAVNTKKIKLLVEAVNAYVLENNLDVEVRFDIVAVIKNKKETTINHLKDAFYHF